MMYRSLTVATPNTNSIGNTHKQFKYDGCVVMKTGVGYKHEEVRFRPSREMCFGTNPTPPHTPRCKILFNYAPKLTKVYVFSKLEKC